MVLSFNSAPLKLWFAMGCNGACHLFYTGAFGITTVLGIVPRLTGLGLERCGERLSPFNPYYFGGSLFSL